MRKVILILVIIANAIMVNGQTANSPIFSKIETLLNKAKGKVAAEYKEGPKFKVGKQEFSYNRISVEKKFIDDEAENKEYLNIDWSSYKKYTISTAKDSDLDLQVVVVHFDKEFEVKGGYYSSSKSKMLEFYVRTKDYSNFIELFNSLIK